MNSRQNSFSGLATPRRHSSLAQAQPQSPKQSKSIIEIYTDWANHYLDKLKGSRKITDLQMDLADGIILCDVIEGVTGQKISNIHKKPKNATQMVENIQACLNFLSAKGVSVTDVQAKDVKEGNLKAILSLFFQLSRYKQQQKMLHQDSNAGHEVSYGFQSDRGGTPRIPSVPPSPCKTIPKMVNGVGGSPTKKLTTGIPSCLPGPRVMSSGIGMNRFGGPSTHVASNPPPPSTHLSFMDKFKPTCKSSSIPSPRVETNIPSMGYDDLPRGLGKRTSSSSGFSSARSISSKSSASLSSDTNFISPSSMKRIQENVAMEQSLSQVNVNKVSSPVAHKSPKQQRSVANGRKSTKIPNGGGASSIQSRSPCSSPKRSPKLVRAGPGTELKDYGPIDHRVTSKYPPHAYPANGSGNFKQQIPTQNFSKIPNLGQSGLQRPAIYQNGLAQQHSQPAKQVAKPAIEPQQQITPQGELLSEASLQQPRAYSLPRPKRDEACPSNVAIVSPMPSSSSASKIVDSVSFSPQKASTPLKSKEEPNLNQVPTAMLPISHNSNPEPAQCRQQYFPHQIPNTTTIAMLVPSGNVSDSSSNRQGSLDNNGGHYSTGLYSQPQYSYDDTKSDLQEDGYYSEGGASLYARKIQSKIAIEKQKTAEEQRKKLEEAFENKTKMRRPLPGLPDVLAPSTSTKEVEKSSNDTSPQSPKAIYRVIGGRKHVQKSEASIQTESSQTRQGIDQQYDWKKAMAHNARVLSSQEKAMDEYLRRQRSSQPQGQPSIQLSGHEQLLSLQDPYVPPTPKMPLTGMLPSAISSTPATPTGTRRAHYQQLQQQQLHHQINVKGGNGGSLERQFNRPKPDGIDHSAFSDSEYARYVPHIQENPYWKKGSPSPSQSPTPTKRDAVFGSRSLPKGTSSLNYGLMLDRIQQKRQYRSNRANDGSLSDSNYATYESQLPRNQYTWLHPASTYSMSSGNNDGYHSGFDAVGSTESLNSVTSSIQQARASSLTKPQLLLHQRQLQAGGQESLAANPPPSSTSSVGRSETDYYAPTRMQTPTGGFRFKSQPTSPLKNTSIVEELARANNDTNASHYGYGNFVGSSLSLQSDGTQISHVDKQTEFEIQKLRRELAEEHEKVLNLSSQLVTNSHVVSAFEQSLQNMTARLHQLTATTEKKDFELNELRRTIDKLKQAGCDAGLLKDQKLSRQGSNDSVDSLQSGDENSSVSKKSNVPKRSGWLRHSFSKAFSKTGSKGRANGRSSGSLSDVEGYEGKRSNGQDPHVRCTSAASGSVLNSNFPIQASISTADLESRINVEVIDDLKQKLNEKDSQLIEIRLEALSSTHQLESMRETMTKMRNELMSLKMENEKLQTLVVQKSSPMDPGLHGDMEMERRPLSTLSDNSIMSGPSSLDLSGSTDPTNKDGGKHLTVSVLLGPENNDQRRTTKLGTVAVSGKSNWELLDSLIQRLFKEYLMRIDPICSLGLSAESIEYYQVGEFRRQSNCANPELLPYGYIFGDVTDIQVRLRRAQSPARGSGLGQPPVDELAFDTLTPKSIVQRYTSLLLEQKRLIISGPPSCGKTMMAQKLATFLVEASGDCPSKNASIVTFTIQMNNLNELREFFNLRLSPSSPTNVAPKVVILKNLHQGGCLDDLFRAVIPANISTASPYIIGTLNPLSLSPSTPTGSNGKNGQSPTSTTPSNVTTNLQLHFNFRCVIFSLHMEPLRGFLGRFLRQRLLAIEARSKVQDNQMMAVVEWLVKVHAHLNKIMESHSCGSDNSLGVSLFMNCPIDDAVSSRNWFIKTWNETILPHMKESIKEGLMLHGQRYSWTDPCSLIIESWPWWVPPDGQLGQLNPDDVGYDVSKFFKSPSDRISQVSRPSSSPGTTSTSGEESDPLYSMLLHLQEAASNETFAE